MSDTTDAGVATGPRPLSPLGGWLLGRRARPTMSQDERDAVIGDLFIDASARAAYLWRFFVLLILSTLIATLALIASAEAASRTVGPLSCTMSPAGVARTRASPKPGAGPKGSDARASR